MLDPGRRTFEPHRVSSSEPSLRNRTESRPTCSRAVPSRKALKSSAIPALARTTSVRPPASGGGAPSPVFVVSDRRASPNPLGRGEPFLFAPPAFAYWITMSFVPIRQAPRESVSRRSPSAALVPLSPRQDGLSARRRQARLFRSGSNSSDAHATERGSLRASPDAGIVIARLVATDGKRDPARARHARLSGSPDSRPCVATSRAAASKTSWR